MGQRANLIVVQNDDYELYTNRWFASCLEAYLFWGPLKTVNWIRSHDPQKSYWLDTIWCEGGAVVDLTNSHLLLFGGDAISFDVQLRQLYLEMLQYTWPGWTIAWANRGIPDLAAYVHYDEKQVIAKRCSEFWQTAKLKEAFSPCSREDACAIVSIVRGCSTFVFSSNTLPLLDALFSGPEILQYIPDNLSETLDLSTVSELPMVGMHIDIDHKELLYWTTDLGYAGVPYGDYWKDWRLINLHDDYSRHFALLENRILLPRQGRAELLDRIEQAVLCETLVDEQKIEQFYDVRRAFMDNVFLFFPEHNRLQITKFLNRNCEPSHHINCPLCQDKNFQNLSESLRA